MSALHYVPVEVGSNEQGRSINETQSRVKWLQDKVSDVERGTEEGTSCPPDMRELSCETVD